MRPIMSERAIAYAWTELLSRVGLTAATAHVVRFVYPAQDEEIVPDASGIPMIVVRRASDEAWKRLLDTPAGSLPAVSIDALLPSTTTTSKQLPVLFGGNTDGRYVRWLGVTSVELGIDVVATAFFMLTRWEEVVQNIADAHGRFPASASLASKHGFLDLPVVDEYAMVLRAWVQHLCPGWTPARPRFAVRLSHDVDRLRTINGKRGAVRRLAGDLLKRRSAGAFARTLRTVVREARDPATSSAMRGVLTLMDESRMRGMQSTFFFIAAAPGGMNGDYRITDPVVVQLIHQMVAAGFEVGVHGSYETMNDAQRLHHERRCMQHVAGVIGNRQHYLRFRVPETWRAVAEAGFEYDASAGYADHEGFRCGTCHPYTVYDARTDAVVPIQEMPLIVMDVTLRTYRAMSPKDAIARIGVLARRCRDVEGVFTLLWHNTSLEPDWPGWGIVYTTALDDLAALERNLE